MAVNKPVAPSANASAAAIPSPTALARQLRQQHANDRDVANNLYKRLKEERKVDVMIAPQYRPWFGETMSVLLGGVAIYVPCDGMKRAIPKSFARIVQARLRAVNDFLLKKDRMSQVQNNFETYAGELKF